jgi:hypothetical protein
VLRELVELQLASWDGGAVRFDMTAQCEASMQRQSPPVSQEIMYPGPPNPEAVYIAFGARHDEIPPEDDGALSAS